MHRRITAGVLLSCCACQAYTPIAVTPTTVDQEVRVTLTNTGRAASYGPIGSGIASMEGRLTGVTDSTLSLSVTSVTRAGSDDEARAGEAVTLSRSNIASVEHRQVSVPRSLLVAGAVLGGSILVARAAGNNGGQDAVVVGGPPPGTVK